MPVSQQPTLEQEQAKNGKSWQVQWQELVRETESALEHLSFRTHL